MCIKNPATEGGKDILWRIYKKNRFRELFLVGTDSTPTPFVKIQQPLLFWWFYITNALWTGCDNMLKSLWKFETTYKLSLNYSRNSVWTDNCAMNLKIDPCSHNTAQLTRQKGIKSLWQSSEQLLSCQGSLIVAIPAVRSAYRYLKVSHRIHSYKGSCYTTWMWYILLNGLLLQQSSAVLNGRYQCAYFAYFLITPIV